MGFTTDLTHSYHFSQIIDLFLQKNYYLCNITKQSVEYLKPQTAMKITKEKHIIIAALGIMLLAASVNIIEMMCSVGLPLLFTQILSMNSLSTPEYLLYMFVYILFFLIDDIIIFVISMITLKVTGISTKYAKYSHLIGGIIMIIIGVLLIVKPSLLMFNF